MEANQVRLDLLANVKRASWAVVNEREQERKTKLIRAVIDQTKWTYNVYNNMYTFTDICVARSRTNDELQEVFIQYLGKKAMTISRSPWENCKCNEDDDTDKCDCAFQFLIIFYE